MRALLMLPAASALAALAFAVSAGATPPESFVDSVAIQDVDTTSCSFPIVRDLVFTNAATAFFDADGNIVTLTLRQSTVGTLTGNGVTLRMNIRETIMVEFENGLPVTAKHVGQLDYIGGSAGQPVFHRTGQAVYDVVCSPSGCFDAAVIARHGLRDDLNAAAFCGSFG